LSVFEPKPHTAYIIERCKPMKCLLVVQLTKSRIYTCVTFISENATFIIFKLIVQAKAGKRSGEMVSMNYSRCHKLRRRL